MKRIACMALALALLMAGLVLPVPASADDAHPITLTVACDPAPELEGDGTIPELLFTIRNESQSDYTLEKAKLSGGFEEIEMTLDESITVLAGGTREVRLTDVPVRADQLDVEIVYLLSWTETETVIDEETGDATFIKHPREASASILIERFVVPELTVSASCETPRVRADETFTVVYTVRNDTQFDMTGLRLLDPEQSMQTIPLPATELNAGQGFTVSVEYKMGAGDMTFCPRIEYVARRREMTTEAATPLIVESVVVDLVISAQQNPATEEGTTFIITVKNNGNRTVTNIRLYDEINTPIGQPFDLGPDQIVVRQYTVVPAISSDVVRTVRFHAEATDALDAHIYVEDPNAYSVLPYVTSDEVRLGLYVVLQSPYYDENGKLCATIQCEIRNYSDLRIRNAKLTELTLFGVINTYDELRHGETYFTRSYQLDGVQELRFRLDAVDPAGQPCSSETIQLDLSDLKAIADSKTDPVYVYTVNPYLSDLGAKYTGGMKTVAAIILIVAGVCAIACISLFAVELHLKNKLPARFEDDMEKTVRTAERRREKQLFTDAPTVQFGYTAPIKLRNYGELTEEEAKARREQYRKGLEENLKREGAQPAPPQSRKPRQPVRPTAEETAAFQRPKPIPVPEPSPEPEPIPTPQPAGPQPVGAEPIRPEEKPDDMSLTGHEIPAERYSPSGNEIPSEQPVRGDILGAPPEPEPTLTSKRSDTGEFVRPKRTSVPEPAPEPGPIPTPQPAQPQPVGADRIRPEENLDEMSLTGHEIPAERDNPAGNDIPAEPATHQSADADSSPCTGEPRDYAEPEPTATPTPDDMSLTGNEIPAEQPVGGDVLDAPPEPEPVRMVALRRMKLLQKETRRPIVPLAIRRMNG